MNFLGGRRGRILLSTYPDGGGWFAGRRREGLGFRGSRKLEVRSAVHTRVTACDRNDAADC